MGQMAAVAVAILLPSTSQTDRVAPVEIDPADPADQEERVDNKT